MVRLEIRRKVRHDALQNILARHPEQAILQNVVLTRSGLSQGAPFILDADLEDHDALIHFDGLKKVEGQFALGNFHYVPVLFHEGHHVRKLQRVLLEVLGLYLSRVQGQAPARAVLCHGRRGTVIELYPPGIVRPDFVARRKKSAGVRPPDGGAGAKRVSAE